MQTLTRHGWSLAVKVLFHYFGLPTDTAGKSSIFTYIDVSMFFRKNIDVSIHRIIFGCNFEKRFYSI